MLTPAPDMTTTAGLTRRPPSTEPQREGSSISMNRNEPRAVPPAVDHWSLHKGPDKYELLAQIRPTDAYDGILLHRIGMDASELAESIVTHDGRVRDDIVKVEVAWFRSEWRWEDDGGLSVTKRSVNEGEIADDVMLVVTVPLAAPGGTR